MGAGVYYQYHYQGKAAANALQLRSMMEDQLVRVPPPLLARYPQLEPFAAGPATPVFEDTLFRLR